MKKLISLMIIGQLFLCNLVLANNITLNYVPLASNTEQQGFIRIVNETSSQAVATIIPIDDAGNIKPSMSVSLSAYETKTYNSIDIENGNTSKGLVGAAGQGIGNWRLAISSTSQISAMGLIRSPSGFLNSMHDIAPAYLSATLHEIGMFNPAANINQQSKLRLSNNTDSPNTFSITGIDDSGKNAGSVSITVAGFATATVTSVDIEQGNTTLGLSGALGKGFGKWKLVITSTQNASVQSIMELPGGYISNISSLANLPITESSSSTSSNSSSVTCSDLNGASIFSQEDEPVYLGFFGNKFASNSINSQFGNFGGQFGSSSIRNSFSNYGSQFSSYGVNNGFASYPPVIIKNGKSIAYLSKNSFLTGLPSVTLAVIDSSCTFSASSPAKPFSP